MPTTLPPLPGMRAVPADEVRAALDGAPRVVFLDDDPTGTQTVRDLPVLTRWSVDDVCWALEQATTGFFVLTNTRSLAPDEAVARIREIVTNTLSAAETAEVRTVFASRGDSTLRGHHPLETDTITDVLAEHGTTVDAVVLCPAYVDAGRITVDGVHYLRTVDELLPVAESEFARDATFGYRRSRLSDWVEEKSQGRVPAASVQSLTVGELRTDDRDALCGRLADAAAYGVVTLDAVEDDDLRTGVLALAGAEREGATFVYRCGPSFVRARTGQDAAPPIDGSTLHDLVGSAAHGLVVVGSHVGQTSRQLAELTGRRTVCEVELDVHTLLDPATADAHIEQVVEAVVTGLGEAPVVLRTSRTPVLGDAPEESLDIARRVSGALTDAVARAVGRRRPGYVVAKGGITSSDIATHALGITRARVRGSMLPGLVSLWDPQGGLAARLPYVVFAGNVGDDKGLADVIDRLEAAR